MAGIEAKRVEYMGRRAVVLANDQVRTVVDAYGTMMPEFGLRRGAGMLNSHWMPDFRDTSGLPYAQERHGAYWKVKLLYHIAGDFLCSPSFGAPNATDGIDHPVHGWTANEEWVVEGAGVDQEQGAAWGRFSLKSPAPAMPLRYDKLDLVLVDQPAYFSVTRITNPGAKPLAINVARHNTIGAPFLQPGCLISTCADRYLSAPKGTEFDTTGRLVQGAEFASLAEVPLRSGGAVDLRVVPGMIGYTDFVTGAVPASRSLGWSCALNPDLGLAYVCFFPGSTRLPEGEIALTFNDLWMQYGGRAFTPWALFEGSEDRTFCLGTENGVGAFANGLAYSRSTPELLGRPTTVEIPAGGARTLYYGTALVSLDDAMVHEGVQAVEAEQGKLVLKGERSFQRANVGADMAAVRRLAARLMPAR